jgi:hypothetical protein
MVEREHHGSQSDEERTFFFGFLRLQATLLTSPEGEGAAAGTFF